MSSSSLPNEQTTAVTAATSTTPTSYSTVLSVPGVSSPPPTSGPSAPAHNACGGVATTAAAGRLDLGDIAAFLGADPSFDLPAPSSARDRLNACGDTGCSFTFDGDYALSVGVDGIFDDTDIRDILGSPSSTGGSLITTTDTYIAAPSASWAQQLSFDNSTPNVASVTRSDASTDYSNDNGSTLFAGSESAQPHQVEYTSTAAAARMHATASPAGSSASDGSKGAAPRRKPTSRSVRDVKVVGAAKRRTTLPAEKVLVDAGINLIKPRFVRNPEYQPSKHDSAEQKAHKTMMRNREAAAESRALRRTYVKRLEDTANRNAADLKAKTAEAEQLRQENEELQARLQAALAEASSTADSQFLGRDASISDVGAM